MNEQSITIRWEKNPDGSTDISVSGDINGQMHFREAFLSLDMLPPLYDISETNTSGESAGNSATASLLRSLIEIIRKSNKTSGHIITEQKRNLKFPLTDLITIRKFAQIAGIKIDEYAPANSRTKAVGMDGRGDASIMWSITANPNQTIKEVSFLCGLLHWYGIEQVLQDAGYTLVKEGTATLGNGAIVPQKTFSKGNKRCYMQTLDNCMAQVIFKRKATTPKSKQRK